MSEISNASDSIEKLSAARSRILEQLSQIIVGQEEVVEQLLISIFSRGHCLLEKRSAYLQCRDALLDFCINFG